MTLAARDPLVRPKRNAGWSSALAVAFIVAAIAVHAIVIATAFVAGTAFARVATAPVYEPIEVSMIETVEEPESEPPPPEPEIEEKPEPPKPKKAPPAPDPIDLPPEPPPPEEKPKDEPRRIVGINLESTVHGAGPSFAVGNTRMGKTEKVAEDPNAPEPLPKEPAPVNRTATRIPASKSVLVKPKPIGGMREPPYPELYKAQNLEADVTVRVRIDVTGQAKEVEIVSPAAQPEFNRAAEETAQDQKFEPAIRDGAPIEWTITFTYRFRLVD